MNIALHYRYRDGSEKIYRSSAHEVIIGRPNDVPITLDLSPDTKVSRLHARLYYDLSIWWIEDFGSGTETILNDKRLVEPTSLSPGDQLKIGETVLRVEFVRPDTDPGPGLLESHFTTHETQPPPSVSEDKRLEILVKISTLVAYSRGRQAILEGCLREITTAFPKSERKTILLIEDKELVPCVYWPPDQSYVSFTLARQAIRKQQAFYWVRQIMTEDGTPLPESLYNTTAALYAPMLCNGRVIGVIHVDTTSPGVVFSEKDLQLLSVIANTIGPAIKTSDKDAVSQIPSVFISYAHKDRNFVDRLASDLRRRRVKVWFDERLQSGEAWRRQLAIAIENTNAFVLVMSPASVASQTVVWEIDTAQALNKKIIPLMYQDCTIPKTILPVQYLPVGANYSKSIDDLVERLDLQDFPSSGEQPPISNEKMQQVFNTYILGGQNVVSSGISSVHGELMGDTFNMSGDFRNAILNIKSTLVDVRQSVNAIPNADTSIKGELRKLVDRLDEELQKVPPEKSEEAEAVAESTKVLVEAVNKEKPNKAMIQVSAKGLKQAAKNLAAVTPIVLTIATQIINTVLKFTAK
jgi:hypothetical protein